MDFYRLPTAFVLGSLLLAATLPAHATQWKWRDADGRVQYSDRPPPAYVKDNDILARPRAGAPVVKAPADAASAPASAALKPSLKASDPELEAKKRKVDAEQDAQKKAADDKQAQARAENCQRARNYQKSLNDGIRISRTNNKGEREVLDDKGRADEQKRVNQTIATDCK
jgi:Skp family chaperone for outer membrane proteins